MLNNNRVFDFSNLDYFTSCHDLQFVNGSPDYKHLPPTAFPEAEKGIFTDFFMRKSVEDITCTCEISFEKDFMKEHEVVFRKTLRTFMEFYGICAQLPNASLEDYLKTMEEDQAFCFRKKLEYYDKLSIFLNIVSEETPEPIIKILIPLAVKVVERYDGIKMEEPTLEDILEEARVVSSSAHLEELITLNGCTEYGLKSKAKELLEVYCATVMVVTAQYFNNPYFDNSEGFKRPFVLSDDSEEDSFDATPSKKRKFSF